MSSAARALTLAKQGIKNRLTGKPFCISFEVTHRCNARCKHCHLGGPVQEQRATPRQLGAICRQIQPVVALVSGGEPLLCHDLVQVIEAIRGKNGIPYIAITTNGTLLTREKYVTLRQAGVDRFSISLDYPDDRHDEFRGIPGLYRRIEKLVTELASDNDNAICISCVIQRQNFREIIKIAELGKRWHVMVNFSTYTWLRTNDKDLSLKKEDLPEFIEIIQQLIRFKRAHKNIQTSEYVLNRMVDYFDNGSLPGCSAGKKYFVVNSDGSFSPCGLIMRHYQSRAEIIKEFTSTNDCTHCYTSLRASCEIPFWHLAQDFVQSL